MNLIPLFFRYLRFFKIYSLLLQYPLLLHHTLPQMSSTGFTEFVQPMTPPKSPSPTPLLLSPPENTPNKSTTPPQLAICSEPFPEDDTPVGFIINDPESRHYYPVYVPNPQYGKWDEEEPMVVARYIHYSPDYLSVDECNGKAYPVRTIPVYIGRKSNSYRRMNPTMWEVFQRGSPCQFIIDEAIADLGDPRVVAEVNQYRGKKDLYKTLGDMQ